MKEGRHVTVVDGGGEPEQRVERQYEKEVGEGGDESNPLRLALSALPALGGRRLLLLL